jgi:hypothetical protein
VKFVGDAVATVHVARQAGNLNAVSEGVGTGVVGFPAGCSMLQLPRLGAGAIRPRSRKAVYRLNQDVPRARDEALHHAS